MSNVEECRCYCQGPSEARTLPNSTMIGIGLTMEGINQNNMIYEFMLENSWRPTPRDITKWFGFLRSVIMTGGFPLILTRNRSDGKGCFGDFILHLGEDREYPETIVTHLWHLSQSHRFTQFSNINKQLGLKSFLAYLAELIVLAVISCRSVCLCVNQGGTSHNCCT